MLDFFKILFNLDIRTNVLYKEGYIMKNRLFKELLNYLTEEEKEQLYFSLCQKDGEQCREELVVFVHH